MTTPEQNQNARFDAFRGNGPEPLPPEFEADLRSLDTRMADAAMQSGRRETPDGLEDRVYASSVRLLPRPARRPARRIASGSPLRFPGLVHLRGHLTGRLTGRLAMAASLGLALVLAWSFLKNPAGPLAGPPGGPAPGSGPIAAADPMSHVAIDLAWLSEEPLADMDLAVAHLLDTDLLTLADLTGEIDSIVASSEM